MNRHSINGKAFWLTGNAYIGRYVSRYRTRCKERAGTFIRFHIKRQKRYHSPSKVMNKYLNIVDIPPVDGCDIITTIDVGMQDIAEKHWWMN